MGSARRGLLERSWVGGVAALAGAFAFVAGGCAISTPLRGPGLADGGEATPGVGDTVWLAMTHARLDTHRRERFDEHTWRVYDAMPEHEGLVLYSVGKRLFGDEAWTLTIWRDHDALDRFATSRSHVDAIDAGRPALRRIRSHVVEIPAAEIPRSWSDAFDIVDATLPADEDAFPRMRRWLP